MKLLVVSAILPRSAAVDSSFSAAELIVAIAIRVPIAIAARLAPKAGRRVSLFLGPRFNHSRLIFIMRNPLTRPPLGSFPYQYCIAAARCEGNRFEAAIFHLFRFFAHI